MTPRSYALDQLSWLEAGRVIAQDSRLIFPIGALEQHGPHLPLGTNALIAERVAREVSYRLRILCAPTLPFGAIPNTPRRFAGRAGLGRKTLHRAVNDLVAQWEDDGISEIIIVTAHRYEPHLDALLMALSAVSTTTVIDLHLIDVQDLLDTAPAHEHGGELETSLMLFLAPDQVRMGSITEVGAEANTGRTYTRAGMPTPPIGSQGHVGRPERASEEKGRLVFSRYVATVVGALGGASPDSNAGETAPSEEG